MSFLPRPSRCVVTRVPRREALVLSLWVSCALATVPLAAPSGARAQDASATQSEPSAADRAAAAEAFDRGTRAYISHDYPHAAEWFETAYRMAPAAAALIQAVRSHERAGNLVRAATLALRLEAQYEGDRQAARQAQQTLRHASELVRVDVTCDAQCTIELDNALMEHPSFFVAPGTEHTVRATFSTGAVERPIPASEAGSTQALSLEAPPPPPEPIASADGGGDAQAGDGGGASDGAAGQGDGSGDQGGGGGGGGLHPAIAITGAALTAVAGGVLIWSGVDALDGVPAYQADPTPARLADGQDRELRTNVLIGVTAGLAATTVVLLLLTDWGGGGGGDAHDEAPAVQASVAPIDGGAYGTIAGRF